MEGASEDKRTEVAPSTSRSSVSTTRLPSSAVHSAPREIREVAKMPTPASRVGWIALACLAAGLVGWRVHSSSRALTLHSRTPPPEWHVWGFEQPYGTSPSGPALPCRWAVLAPPPTRGLRAPHKASV